METLGPELFYKYRGIDSYKAIEEDFAIKALLGRYIKLSNRVEFNDIFDSQVKIIQPTPKEMKLCFSENKKSWKKIIKNEKLVIKGSISTLGEMIIKESIIEIEELLDENLFYCLSLKNNSNLMWSHYASNHYGFCIEFKFPVKPPDKVIYTSKIPEIKLTDFLGRDENRKILSKQIWQALRNKLDEWAYEEEYRLQISTKTKIKTIPVGQNSSIKILEYSPSSVESVIFGCRMIPENREYIMKNHPFPVKFKEVIKLDSSLGIRDLKI